MISRQMANSEVAPLLELIERRFALRLPIDSREHLLSVMEHYSKKRQMILWEQGEAAALINEEYAKAVMISETIRLVLREIDPWPRRKKVKKGTANGR